MNIYLKRLSSTVTSIESSETQVISGAQYGVKYNPAYVEVYSENYTLNIKTSDTVWIEGQVVNSSNLISLTNALVNFLK